MGKVGCDIWEKWVAVGEKSKYLTDVGASEACEVELVHPAQMYMLNVLGEECLGGRRVSPKNGECDMWGKHQQKNTFLQSLPKCRTPTFAICQKIDLFFQFWCWA